MKRINYKSIKTIKRKYETYMSHAINDVDWQRVRRELCSHVPDFNDSNLPRLHKDILSADFKTLAKIFVIYKKNKIETIFPKLHKKLKQLFNYDFEGFKNPNSGIIKRFFCENSDLFGISTCHYCDMTYVNIYGGDDNVKDCLNFLNTASFEVLEKVLKYKSASVKKITDQRDRKLFSSSEDFTNRIKDRRVTYEHVAKKIMKVNEYHAHFDLDHFLDKASCPIIAISVFNFVPSCTICNQRIKHSKVLGDLDVAQLCHYSPTCNNYTFETDVKLKVKTDNGLPFLDYVKNIDRCRIEFVCSGKKNYEREIEFFRLKERYHYHRIEALRLMDLRQRYDHGANIDEIARLIYGNNSEENKKRVRDDIFQTYFKNDNSRTFGKLYKDILSE